MIKLFVEFIDKRVTFTFENSTFFRKLKNTKFDDMRKRIQDTLYCPLYSPPVFLLRELMFKKIFDIGPVEFDEVKNLFILSDADFKNIFKFFYFIDHVDFGERFRKEIVHKIYTDAQNFSNYFSLWEIDISTLASLCVFEKKKVLFKFNSQFVLQIMKIHNGRPRFVLFIKTDVVSMYFEVNPECKITMTVSVYGEDCEKYEKIFWNFPNEIEINITTQPFFVNYVSVTILFSRGIRALRTKLENVVACYDKYFDLFDDIVDNTTKTIILGV